MELTHDDLVEIANLIAERIKFHLAGYILTRWLTVKEAMAYTEVKNVATIREWLKRGYIKGRKRGGNGNWVIDRLSIDEWYGGGRKDFENIGE